MIDVLNLEWHSYPSRDNNITTLVCNFLRTKKITVKRGCIFEGKQLIYKYKPKLVYIANSVGSPENIEIVKFAKKIGCLVVTGVSEGNLQPRDVHQKFWGWNKDKIMYEDINMQWSERSRSLIIKHYPKYSSRVKVSGGVGFDTYTINKDRKDIINSFKNKYSIPPSSKIVGFACYDFGMFYKEDSRHEIIKTFYNQTQIVRFKQDGLDVNKILLNLIKKNPHIHFLIKEHPGSGLGDKASSIEGIRVFKNITIIKHEEEIADCIAVSDIWLGYETTTVIEAWLTEKVTILINPSGSDFPRYTLYKGALIAKTGKELQTYIDAYFSHKEIPEYSALLSIRNEESKHVIGWSDGLNHIRAGKIIIEIINNNSTICKKNIFALKEVIIEYLLNHKIAGYIINRGLSKFRRKKLSLFDYNQLKEYEKEKYSLQKKFYKTKKEATLL